MARWHLWHFYVTLTHNYQTRCYLIIFIQIRMTKPFNWLDTIYTVWANVNLIKHTSLIIYGSVEVVLVYEGLIQSFGFHSPEGYDH